MTKKDFVAIAARLAAELATARRLKADAIERKLVHAANIWDGHAGGVIASAEALANLFEMQSPRFDRARFLAACGVTR